jgi:hypothetical protein
MVILLDPADGRGDIAVKDFLYQNAVINLDNCSHRCVALSTFG